MNLTIRVTERTGDTERTIVIGEPPRMPQLSAHAIDLGQFLSGGKAARDEAGVRFMKLDAKFQPVPGNAVGSAWVYTHDRTTDLVWARAESSEEMNHEAAAKFCAAVGDGFRMPTIQERLSLVDYDRHEPAIDTAFFDSQKSGWSWTSTDAAWSKDAKTGKASAAWVVSLGDGYAYGGRRGDGAFVRAVRSAS
jgi:hypothetical protein